MPRIRFLADLIHETQGFQKGPRFTVGQIVTDADLKSILDLDAVPSAHWADAWMRRWVDQGLAEWSAAPQSEPVAASEPVEATEVAEAPKRRGRPPKVRED